MAKRIITREIKDQIYDMIDRQGFATVDAIANSIRKLIIYDPKAVEDQWYRDKARRLLAQKKDENGIRSLYATKSMRGIYVNVDTCRDLPKVKAVRRQLEEKRDGLNASIAKANRRVAELSGQMTVDDLMRGELNALCH